MRWPRSAARRKFAAAAKAKNKRTKVGKAAAAASARAEPWRSVVGLVVALGVRVSGTYHRDAKGRFAPTPEAQKRKRRRRAAVAGSAVAAGVVVTQARPASRSRTAMQRRRIVAHHVARAQADHEHLASVRARVFPTTAVTGRKFDADAARREARRLTAGYRKEVKRSRRKR